MATEMTAEKSGSSDVHEYPLTGVEAFCAMVCGGALIARVAVKNWKGSGVSPESFMRWDGECIRCYLGDDDPWKMCDNEYNKSAGFNGDAIRDRWRVVTHTGRWGVAR